VPTHEVATRLGLSATDVMNYLHRSKARFREIARRELLGSGLSAAEVADEIRGLIGWVSGSAGR
jgi:hypothetical protein